MVLEVNIPLSNLGFGASLCKVNRPQYWNHVERLPIPPRQPHKEYQEHEGMD